MPNKGSEFEIIQSLFLPLATHRTESLKLQDDAAVISINSGTDMVISTDCLISGIHFLNNDPPSAVAARCLRVNLSDLAAMGAEPDSYTLAIAIPSGLDRSWLETFTNQLAKDQKRFSIDLLGGDTVSTLGPLTVTITAIARSPHGHCIRRSTANPQDDIYVSGTIGDAKLGLEILTGRLNIDNKLDKEFLKNRFWYPSPRTALGPMLSGVASAMTDISDGLAKDLNHICSTSGVSAKISANLIPLSEATQNLKSNNLTSITEILTGGDDYELVFTALPKHRERINKLSCEVQIPITRIGSLEESMEKSIRLLDKNGSEIHLDKNLGYEHRW